MRKILKHKNKAAIFSTIRWSDKITFFFRMSYCCLTPSVKFHSCHGKKKLVFDKILMIIIITMPTLHFYSATNVHRSRCQSHSYKLIRIISYQSLLLFVLTRDAERTIFMAIFCLNPHSVLYATKDLSGFANTVHCSIKFGQSQRIILYTWNYLNGVHFQIKGVFSLCLLLDATLLKFRVI